MNRRWLLIAQWPVVAAQFATGAVLGQLRRNWFFGMRTP
jgi:hypothetical protein